MASFKNFIPKEALVLRDGVTGKKEAKYLVPGDIITIKAGDSIPADCILITANEMKVNNASLTGESEDILREVDVKTSNICGILRYYVHWRNWYGHGGQDWRQHCNWKNCWTCFLCRHVADNTR